MNRIQQKLQESKKLLSIYFTAGYPKLDDTVTILKKLEESGVDMVEIGLPFSDPLADGTTIQHSSTMALENGMTTKLLFSQLEKIRSQVSVPLLIMGYFNPVLQYDVEKFCKKCSEIEIDGLIIPDLPIDIYKESYQSVFEKYGLINIFLITPQTSDDRIREIDRISNGFIYMVSSASVTGKQSGFGEKELDYFERVSKMGLKNPLITGFGIHDKITFEQATHFTKGAIIGSAFINNLKANGVESTDDFINRILK